MKRGRSIRQKWIAYSLVLIRYGCRVREALVNGETDNDRSDSEPRLRCQGGEGWAKTVMVVTVRIILYQKCGMGENGKSIKKSAICLRDRIRLPCKASILQVLQIKNQWHEGWGQEGDKTNDILAYLFGNDASEPLLHVTACPQEENVAGNCEEVTWTGETFLAGKWLCNGTSSAQVIFEENGNNYLNVVDCYVGEDGKLRVGVKMSAVTWGDAWVVYASFQIKYLGVGNMEGLKRPWMP